MSMLQAPAQAETQKPVHFRRALPLQKPRPADSGSISFSVPPFWIFPDVRASLRLFHLPASPHARFIQPSIVSIEAHTPDDHTDERVFQRPHLAITLKEKRSGMASSLQ
jgi:hypothetical protein